MGLNDEYSNARGQILMKTTPPTIDQACALIIQDKNQKSSSLGPLTSLTGNFQSGGGMDPTTLFTTRRNAEQKS